MEEDVYHVHDGVRQRLRARSQKDCHIPMVGWIKGHGNIQYIVSQRWNRTWHGRHHGDVFRPVYLCRGHFSKYCKQQKKRVDNNNYNSSNRRVDNNNISNKRVDNNNYKSKQIDVDRKQTAGSVINWIESE
nr:uncharacterized protein LOC118877764 isoform X2 [Drosophila suzukii]